MKSQKLFKKSVTFVIPRYSEGSRDDENRLDARDPSEYLGMTGLGLRSRFLTKRTHRAEAHRVNENLTKRTHRSRRQRSICGNEPKIGPWRGPASSS
jgi:hypothetical protein